MSALESPATPAVQIRDDERDRALDGVRGFALVMVLLIHCYTPLPLSTVETFFYHLFDSFWLAIDLFFVLSGFLITGILLRTRGHPAYYRNFYARRALRIMPAYAVVLLLLFLLYRPFYPALRDAPLEPYLPWYLFYVQNLAMAFQGDWVPAPGVNHLWSLAIEEQFYLLWPLVVAFAPTQRMMRITALIYLLSVASKFVLVAVGATAVQVYVSTPARLDGVAAGAFVAVYRHLWPERGMPPWFRALGILGGLALLAVFVVKYGLHLNSPLQVAVCSAAGSAFFAFCLFHVVTARDSDWLRRLLQRRTLIFLGTYSYGVYLLHAVIYWQIRTGIDGALPEVHPSLRVMISGTIVIACSITLALIQWKLVEAPMLRLKRHFPYGRGRQPDTPVAPAAASAAPDPRAS